MKEMVQIKQNYRMSESEKREYERADALPRKTSGRVDYYFKPQTKYPPRIYVFMHAEIWCDRNRRPMGLHHAFPFLSRPMNKGEIEYHHFDWRLCYHQYETWERLLYAEEQEVQFLDEESPGSGSDFINALTAFREQFNLADQPENTITINQPEIIQTAQTPFICLDVSEAEVLGKLVAMGSTFSPAVIAVVLESEQQGLKRKAVLIALQFLYRNCVLEPGQREELTLDRIVKKTATSENRSRRNFVRRVYAKNKLFALEEIHTRYPDYDEKLLAQDLILKSKKQSRKKRKPVVDLRRCQLEKLAMKLRFDNVSEEEYRSLCCRIVMLEHAHQSRLPIPLTVKLQGESKVYYFDWKTRETVIKQFVEVANAGSVNHESLQKRYNELCASPNSR